MLVVYRIPLSTELGCERLLLLADTIMKVPVHGVQDSAALVSLKEGLAGKKIPKAKLRDGRLSIKTRGNSLVHESSACSLPL